MQNTQHPEEFAGINIVVETGELYRSLYENSIDAILLTAPNGGILAANPAACAMFGMTEEELKKAGRNGVVDQTDPRLADILKNREKTGRIQGELTGIRKDGSKFPIELTSSIFKDHNGELRTSMIIRDISERKLLETQLHLHFERLGNLIENLPDAVYTLDLKEQKATNLNRRSFLGYSYEELNQAGYLLQQLHPEDEAGVKEYWQKAMRGEASESYEYRLRNKAGNWEWLDSRTSIIARNEDGTPKEIMTILRVITDRKTAEEQIAYQAKILENVNDVIIGTDKSFKIRYWNPAAERTFGWTAEEVQGKRAAEVLRTIFREGGREESIREINEIGVWKGEVTQFTKDGKAVQIDANIMAVKGPDGKVTGYVSANRDISTRKQVEKRLVHAKAEAEAANQELQEALAREQSLARTDGLTDLFNRRHFFDLAEQEFKVAKRYNSHMTIVIMDIDLFKQINDRWGHQTGDEVLKHISRIAASQTRESDILARYGGEEFIILLPNSNAKDAAQVAERVRASVAAYRMGISGASEERITISMGAAELTQDIETLDHLIHNADSALYQAKEAGRNCLRIYSPEETD